MTQGTFVSRAEAESTTLRELLERYIAEVSPTKKGAASEIVRIKALRRNPLVARFVATIRGADIARYREERLLAPIRRQIEAMAESASVAHYRVKYRLHRARSNASRYPWLAIASLAGPGKWPCPSCSLTKCRV